MAEQRFFTKLTAEGLQRYARAGLGDKGEVVHFSSVAVGDGGGNYVEPLETWTRLTNEVWRGALNSIEYIAPEGGGGMPKIVLEVYIPHNVGGFVVRELGFFDPDGVMLAVANYPASEKPSPGQGAGVEFAARFELAHTNAAQTELKIDPAIVMASRKWVEEAIAGLAKIYFKVINLGGTPSTQAFGDKAGAGSSDKAARSDHKHAMPAAPTLAGLGGQADMGITTLGGTPDALTFGQASANGISTAVARADHAHAMPAAPTSVSGNAGTATKLAAARRIGGVSFDGTADIDLPGVNKAGTQDTTGKAKTAAAADAVPWSGVTGKPAAFPAADIALTDAAGSDTLPTTAAGSIASKVQALRNNVKELFRRVRTMMSGTTHIYISETGDNANDGTTPAKAKASLFGAVQAATHYDIRGTATMFFEIDGTVPLFLPAEASGSGNLAISQRNSGLSDRVTIRGSGTGTSKITNNGNGNLQAVQGLTMYISALTVDCPVYAVGGGTTVYLDGNIRFNEHAGSAGSYILGADHGKIALQSNAKVEIAALTLNGFAYANGGNFLAANGASLEFLVPQDYGVGTLRTSHGGHINWGNVTIPVTSKPVTGRKFYLEGAGDSIQSAYMDTIPGSLPGHGLARGNLAGIPMDMSVLAAGENGYMKLQNGLILQWVRIDTPAVPAGEYEHVITWPVAFPKACRGAWVNRRTIHPGNSAATTRSSQTDVTVYYYTSVSVGLTGYMEVFAIGY